MTRRIEDLEVTENILLNKDTSVATFKAIKKLPEILPGQFAEIEIQNAPDVFLRRPFSIHDVSTEDNTISFIIKVVGKGTQRLRNLRHGDNANIIFPLGKGFTILSDKKILMIGGGSGLAPLLLLGRTLKRSGCDITTLIGGRKAEDIVELDVFGEFGDVLVTTEDGSLGEKGLVTQHSFLRQRPKIDMIYTCGPNPMMHAVAGIARSHNTECEVSLENTMACGFGACLCCVVESVDGNVTSCTEGPTFNIKRLKW